MRKQSLLFTLLLLFFLQTKAQNNPLNICYVEVNSNNLLNAGSYTMATSGKQVFDVATIFAGNINKDASTGRAYLYSNNNVTKVLNNVDTYVRPLQAKGIKVLLSLIGNHQGVGILNFQTQADARDFALQIANTVYTYGLDGIDFDDEYADYPTSGNVKNTSSFTMLLQELKQVMPDKLITFYDWSDSGVGSPIDTSYLSYGSAHAGDYIDYAYQGDYGSFTSMAGKVPPLPNSNLGSFAYDFATGFTGYISNYATKARHTPTVGGYGVLIWYNLTSADVTSELDIATKNLYNENTTFSGQSYSWTEGDSCDPPTGLFADKLAGTSAMLSWTADNTKTYNIDYKLASETTWTNVATNFSGSSISINNLTTNADYDWRIQSVSSPTLTSTYIFAPRFNTGNGCITPYDLLSENFKGTSTDLSWEATNASSYTLQYKTPTDADWTTVNNITTNSYSLQGLTPNTIYLFRVQGVCDASTVSEYSEISVFRSGFIPVQSPGNRSLTFNGSTNYVDAGILDLSGNEITIEGWVKPARFTTNFPYISSVAGIESGDSNSVLLRFGDGDIPLGNKLQFVLSFGGAQTKLTTNSTFNTGTWYHVAATYDGSAMKIYINGVLDASVAVSGNFNANGNFYLAARNTIDNDRRFNGQIDEFRIWRRALSASEVATNNCSVPPTSQGLEANWKFNEGSGVAAFDQTINSHFGILTNMTDSNWSIDVACTQEQQLAVNDANANNKAVIYPNPVKRGEDIHFDFKGNSATVFLYDVSGKLIKNQKISGNSGVINTGNLATGLYIYKIQSADDKTQTSGKIIIK